jgi:predicted Zn-dependent protease
MDFGIARLMHTADATRLTQQGFLIGTLRYMAPEQLAGAEFTSLCDIFAYGVIYYELLTGKHPFEAPDAQSLMYKLATNDPPPIRELAPAVPPLLEQVITRLLQKNPGRRYQSLREVQFDTEPVRIELQNGQAAELLAEAQGHFQGQRFEAAQKALDEALALEPTNRAARALWEQLQRRRLQGEENAGKTSQLLAEARRELEQQNLTAAYRIISEALRHDPKNPEAAEFLKTIQAYLERRQAEQRVDELLRKAQGLLLISAYDDAIALLTAASPDADSPRIREFLERVRREKLAHERKQKLRGELARATDLLRDHHFDEATACLEQLHAEYPEDQDVARLLAYAQKERASLVRANALNTLAGEVRARVESQDFEAALATLDKALKEYPGESGLVRLLESTLAARSAREAVRQVCEQAKRLLEQRQPEAAVAAVQQSLNQHPSDPGLEDLLRRAQDAMRAREQVRAIGREAQSLADGGDFDAALALLEDGLQNQPGETSLIRLRDSITAARDRRDRRQRSLEDLEQIKLLSLRAAAEADPAELLARAITIASQHTDDVEIQSAAAEPIVLLSDLARARQELVDGNYPSALEICRRHLVSYPDHAAFLELQSEAERGQRRCALDEAHRQAAAEPNLRKRTLILEAALREFPGDAALADELRLTRNKLALIDSLVERARFYEQACQWEEALEQWNSLHTIDSQYPGVDTEIERVQSARQKALAGLIEPRIQQIQQALDAGDVDVAADLLRQAQTEYPNTPQLQAASRSVQDTVDRRKQARELFARAEAASESGNDAEYQTCLRQAFQMDESDAAFRRVVLNKLIDRAQSATQTDWRQAEALVGEATALQPGFTAPGAVLRAIAESKREASVQPVAATPAPARKRTRRLVAIGAFLVAGVSSSIVAVRLNRRPATVAVKMPVNVPSAPANVPNAPVPVRAKSSQTPEPPPPPELVHAPEPQTAPKKRQEKPVTSVPPPARAHVEIPAANPGTQMRPDSQPRGEIEKPAPPDPKQIEAKDWEQIATSTNPDDFDRFLRNHPGGAHQEQARNRAADLRKLSEANAARQSEQASWEKLDPNNKEQLQEYLSRFPAGAHAQDAGARIAELDRQAAEILIAAQRQRELKELERVKSAADEQAVVKVLQNFDAAYNRRDIAALKKLWDGVPVSAYRQQFREAQDLAFHLEILGQPVVTGNSATAICTRTLIYRGQSGGDQTHSERVKVTLSRERSGWVIRSINVN